MRGHPIAKDKEELLQKILLCRKRPYSSDLLSHGLCAFKIGQSGHATRTALVQASLEHPRN